MPRQPRVFVEGGLYHVYNRASHGDDVFAEPKAGLKFADLLEREIRADGHLVYAWCVMSNHYHVVLRSSPVPLSRTFGQVQSAFGRWRNWSLQARGPTWQSRYQAKLVEDEAYLRQLIAYVHLNPVEAGAVTDPADYELSGHREVLGRATKTLIGRDLVLAIYGSTERDAIRAYLASLSALKAGGERWLGQRPGLLPWWGRQVDRPIEPPPLVAWVDGAGRPNRVSRPRLTAAEYVAAACAALGVEVAEVTRRSRRSDVANQRFLVVGLGIERWGQRAGDLAGVFNRRADFVSWWVRRARERRLGDAVWAARYEALDESLRRRYEDPEG